MSLRYRPDVDGLRAVAIVPVVLFHYGAPGFSGGFTGVDVFFVISGFLITSLILAELREGSFSIANFYERRIRRIFPALFLVIAACAVAGYVLLFPLAYDNFGETAMTTSLFVSNFKFWLETGYFDLAASAKPLLHTWSLAVEEQFYLFFPPLLMAAARWLKGRYLQIILPLLFLSFGFGVWAAAASPVTAFYLLPSRLWELMLGALVAAAPVPVLPDFVRGGIALAGIAAIAAGIAFLSDATPFPGFAALLPCGGAASIIFAGNAGDTPVTRMLSSAPAVFVGKISYSLYLWHWPILIFARTALARDPDLAESALLIALSFLLSVLSWRYVEQPFRRRAIFSWRASLFAVSGSAILAATAMGAVIGVMKGVPQRFDAETRSLLAVEEGGNPAVCPGAAPMASVADPPCVLGGAEGDYRFLLWGDSHADAISRSLSDAAADAGWRGLKAGYDACPPLLGVWNMAPSQCGDTLAHNNEILEIIRKYDVKTVILAARWAVYATGEFVKLEDDPKIYLNDDQSREVSFAENGHVFERALLRTVAALRNEGRRVVIIGPWPEPGLRVPEMLARARLFGASPEIGPTREEFLARQKRVFDAFAKAAEELVAEIMPTHEFFCAEARCKVALNGEPLYWDDDHLSRLGAARLQPLFASIFR